MNERWIRVGSCWELSVVGRVARLSVLLLALAQVTQAQSLYWRAEGKDAQDHLGVHLDNAGDVNGDGLDDVVIGADEHMLVRDGLTGKLLIDYAFDVTPHVAGLGDVNGDGHSDVVVSGPFSIAPGVNGGVATVVSGKTGLKLYTQGGLTSGNQFGAAISGCGDLNDDGVPDFAVGASGSSPQYTAACSGVNGAYLWETTAIANYLTGNLVAGVGDQNLDGIPDVVGGFQPVGSCYVFSGVDGSFVRELPAADSTVVYVRDVKGVGDLDGDGIEEIALGVTGSDDFLFGAGSVDVYRGGTAEILYRAFGQKQSELFGYRVAGRRDLDGDGWPDIVATTRSCAEAFGCNLFPGLVRVLSGPTGEQICEIQDNEQESEFGCSVAVLSDLNGDGLGEFAVGACYDMTSTGFADGGSVNVYSALVLPLSSDKTSIKLPGGGTQKLRIKAGAEHGGEFFVMLGTQSGIVPGLTVSDLHLPLNLDFYSQLSLTPGAALANPIAGLLDGTGKANVQLLIPPGTPATLAGPSFEHIAVLIHPLTGALTKATNCVPLTLTQ